MVPSPSAVGATAEREVAFALARDGWEIFVPFFAPHGQIDIVVVMDQVVHRVQCKSGIVRGSAMIFRPYSNTGNTRRSYGAEIDVFGVHCAALDRVYLVPVQDTAASNCSLRLVPPATNQVAGVRLATHDEVGRKAVARADPW